MGVKVGDLRQVLQFQQLRLAFLGAAANGGGGFRIFHCRKSPGDGV